MKNPLKKAVNKIKRKLNAWALKDLKDFSEKRFSCGCYFNGVRYVESCAFHENIRVY